MKEIIACKSFRLAHPIWIEFLNISQHGDI
jgi:hypothetical protein